MTIYYLVQMYDKLNKNYLTVHKGQNLERAKIMACKPYNTRQGTATTRILKVTTEQIHSFKRRIKY